MAPPNNGFGKLGVETTPQQGMNPWSGQGLFYQRTPEYQGGAAGRMMGLGAGIVGGAMGNVLGTANNFGDMLQGAMGQMGFWNARNQDQAFRNRLVDALLGGAPPVMRSPSLTINQPSVSAAPLGGPGSPQFGQFGGARQVGLQQQANDLMRQQAARVATNTAMQQRPMAADVALRGGILAQRAGQGVGQLDFRNLANAVNDWNSRRKMAFQV